MRELTYAEALREGIRQMMEQDESIFVIGEDVGLYGGAFGVTAGLFPTVDIYPTSPAGPLMRFITEEYFVSGVRLEDVEVLD